jgi:signal transduction histidine kinase
LVIFSFLLYFGVLDTFHSYVGYRGEGQPVTLDRAVVEGLVFWVPYFAVVPCVLYLVNRYRWESRRVARILLVHAATALVFTYAHILTNSLAFAHLGPRIPYAPGFFELLRLDFAIDYLGYWGMVVTGYILQYYSELKQRQLEASQLQVNLTSAQLRALQARLNPHFFFNTLQAVSGLALAGEKDAVVNTLSHLSDLIRVSFDDNRPQRVPLSSEIEFLEGYLAIQQLLFGDRLVLRRYIASEAMEALLPTMVLQPLVENALVHGVAVQPGEGTVAIEAECVCDRLVLRVEDSGPGFGSSGQPKSGIGLNAIQARLALVYGTEYRLDFADSKMGGASVTLQIPLHPLGTG